MTLTIDLLKIAMPHATTRLAVYGQSLIDAMEAADIATPLRAAHFLAQIGHESGDLSRTRENLNYSAAGLLETWPTRFDAATAAEYAHHPERIARRVYASRMGNGDEASGDGARFLGRGFIQLTGRANYEAYGASIGRDLLKEPEAVAQEPTLCVGVATWFWSQHGLNALADVNDLTGITRRINGGLAGKLDREMRLQAAKTATLANASIAV